MLTAASDSAHSAGARRPAARGRPGYCSGVSESVEDNMFVQVVTFRLAGIDEAAYLRRVDAVAPVFAAMPGLRSKIWLADPATGTYGGVYIWTDRESMAAYRGGEVFRQLQ